MTGSSVLFDAPGPRARTRNWVISDTTRVMPEITQLRVSRPRTRRVKRTDDPVICHRQPLTQPPEQQPHRQRQDDEARARRSRRPRSAAVFSIISFISSAASATPIADAIVVFFVNAISTEPAE